VVPFVSYSKLDPQQFPARLEGALQGVLGNPFARAYPEALAVFAEFRAATDPTLVAATKEQFVVAGSALRAAGHNLPPSEHARARAEFLIRRLLSAEPAIPTLSALKEWLEQKYPPTNSANRRLRCMTTSDVDRAVGAQVALDQIGDAMLFSRTRPAARSRLRTPSIINVKVTVPR
jgi:hypothetical protein